MKLNLLSPEYKEQITKLHTTRIWGASGYSHAEEILKYKNDLAAKSVLDYGCGRATLKKVLMELDPSIANEDIREYDPAIPGKDADPDFADLLVATDVLEHIEPVHLRVTLTYLYSLFNKGAYFIIALSASKVDLPDGRNAHLIIQDHNWWIGKLKEAGFKVTRFENRTKGLWVWAR